MFQNNSKVLLDKIISQLQISQQIKIKEGAVCLGCFASSIQNFVISLSQRVIGITSRDRRDMFYRQHHVNF